MEAILFVGIQATGKSSFFRERFFDTHVRINLDMLRTRHRERLLLDACLEGKQPFVVDNTNPTRAERARYVELAHARGFRVIAYFFQSGITGALDRNARRERPVPPRGVRGSHARLQLPSRDEGLDELWFVRMNDDGGFQVEAWSDEVR